MDDKSQGSGSPSGPDRILDRKIERRGLTQSFSSNLAMRAPSSGRKAPDRSVRDMVSLFEKSANAPDSPRSGYTRPAPAPSATEGTREDRRGGHSNVDTKKDDDAAAVSREQPRPHHSQPTPMAPTPVLPPARVGYQVEDYSLTLLKHKSYFNNRPLARCLDERQEKDKKAGIQRAQSRRGGDGQRQQENRDAVPRTRNRTLSSIQQLDSLMDELRAWNDLSESSSPREMRDPRAVDGFWRNVRARLRVDDDEIYGEKKFGETATEEHADVSESFTEGPVVSLSISASSFPLSSQPDPEPESPRPPMPTRAPPPVPEGPFPATSSRQTQLSTAPSSETFPEPASRHAARDEHPRNSSVRLSTTVPFSRDMIDLLYDLHPMPQLPARLSRGRPLRAPQEEEPNHHSRYPSSNGSGHWVRPPTWRSPSSMRSPSPLPPPIPPPSSTQQQHARRSNHSRNRHHHHQRPSTACSSIAATDSSSITPAGRRSPRTTTTPKTSTSSAGTEPHPPPPPPPRRRLTTEEKLSEIDAFLASGRDGEGECWI